MNSLVSSLVAIAVGAAALAFPCQEPGAVKQHETPQPISVHGVENCFRLSPRLYSGSEPQGEASFKDLQALGIKTIITVDGARPDIQTAHKFGIRYVHVPFGYDSVPKDQATKLVAAMKSLPGPVFVHCHHGKHRGPTAAALCGIAAEAWTKEEAIAWLKQAGTSSDYPGLFATVRNFQAPSPKELQGVAMGLPEHAEVPALVEAMVGIDARWDRFKRIREAQFQKPLNEPDVDPVHEAVLLAESFQESLRTEEAKAKGPDFLHAMENAMKRSRELEAALREISKAASPDQKVRLRAEAAFAAVNQSCTACHVRHRN